MWTKEKEINLINSLQDNYVKELIKRIEKEQELEAINFTSPTGTGKSVMMKKLISSEWGKNYCFLITTLSRGGLHHQLRSSIGEEILASNCIIHGDKDLTAKTIFREEDLYLEIEEMSKGRPLIWIKDEAHIEQNNWDNALKDKYIKKINFSATNEKTDIECDFSTTCMLRTPVLEKNPNVTAALDKLMEIKNEHKIVKDYNPCAVFRCINNETLRDIIKEESALRGLKWIDLNEREGYDIQELCDDNNEYDVVIQKLKVQEGVDIRRAHVIYLGNVPENHKTIIQFIGRGRRNALLWRKDFDIFDLKYRDIFESTKRCFIYFNIKEDDKNYKEIEKKLSYVARNTYSVNEYRTGTVLKVVNGELHNGIKILQLAGETGEFVVREKDGFKYVDSYFYHDQESQDMILNKNCVVVQKQELWGLVDSYIYNNKTKKEIQIPKCVQYAKKTNDFESALISGDKFNYYSDSSAWVEEKNVTDRVERSSSLLCNFILKKYAKEIDFAYREIENKHLSSGKNSFNFNTLCNKCLGWLVEYYTKYLIFGREFLLKEIKEAQSEAKTDREDYPIIFYACFLKYKNMMTQTFGQSIGRYIIGPSIQDYIKKDYQTFVDTVKILAEKTKNFLSAFNFTKDGLLYDENLSIEHIRGKADFICEDTIIDLKTTSNITKNHIKQVLAYHYLSTKRSDLNIKKVIVYDCVTDTSLEVKIEPENLTEYFSEDVLLGEPLSSLPRISEKELNDKIKAREEAEFFENNLDAFEYAIKNDMNLYKDKGGFYYLKTNNNLQFSTEKENLLYELFLKYQKETGMPIPWRLNKSYISNSRLDEKIKVLYYKALEIYADSTVQSKKREWDKKGYLKRYIMEKILHLKDGDDFFIDRLVDAYVVNGSHIYVKNDKHYVRSSFGFFLESMPQNKEELYDIVWSRNKKTLKNEIEENIEELLSYSFDTWIAIEDDSVRINFFGDLSLYNSYKEHCKRNGLINEYEGQISLILEEREKRKIKIEKILNTNKNKDKILQHYELNGKIDAEYIEILLKNSERKPIAKEQARTTVATKNKSKKPKEKLKDFLKKITIIKSH